MPRRPCEAARPVATLILIRHGQSRGNAERRFTHGPEEPLTEQGRDEARVAARLVALHQGIVPSVYDSSWVVMYPGAWTPNKDSLKVFAFAGAVIDTVTMNRYRWGYYVVGSDSTAVADTVKCYPR